MSAPEEMTLKVIAHIRTAFPTKFGIPRQSGLVDSLRGEVIFTPEYRNADAVRGLEDFSHIWLVWQFSGAVRDSWSPTVRPPRLGGNTRMGVFATRSPFRPNPLGLSSVQLEAIEHRPDVGPVLIVRGADLMDGTSLLHPVDREYLHGEHTLGEDSMHFILTKEDKYIWYSQTGRELYFNLRDDPHETKNALDENPERVAELRALLINALKNREEQYTDGHTLFVGKTPLTVLQNTEVL